MILDSLEVNWMTSYGGSKRSFCEENSEQIYNKKQHRPYRNHAELMGSRKTTILAKIECNTLLLRLNSILLYIFDKGVAGIESTESVYKEGYSD